MEMEKQVGRRGLGEMEREVKGEIGGKGYNREGKIGNAVHQRKNI
jgi:hypothetical protein